MSGHLSLVQPFLTCKEIDIETRQSNYRREPRTASNSLEQQLDCPTNSVSISFIHQGYSKGSLNQTSELISITPLIDNINHPIDDPVYACSKGKLNLSQLQNKAKINSLLSQFLAPSKSYFRVLSVYKKFDFFCCCVNFSNGKKSSRARNRKLHCHISKIKYKNCVWWLHQLAGLEGTLQRQLRRDATF